MKDYIKEFRQDNNIDLGEKIYIYENRSDGYDLEFITSGIFEKRKNGRVGFVALDRPSGESALILLYLLEGKLILGEE